MKFKFEVKVSCISIFELCINKSFRPKFKCISTEWLNKLICEFSIIKLPIEHANVIISIDWNEWVEEFLEMIDLEIPASEIIEDYDNYLLLPDIDHSSFSEFFETNYKKYNGKEIVSIRGEIEHDLKKYETQDLFSITFFHIWRCANIAFPSVLNLYNSDVVIDDECFKINFCTDSLGNIFLNEYTTKYKRVEIIDISKCWGWYQTIIDTTKYYTNNAFDRALSGLFNYIRHESFIQSNIINLFLGIESFYSLGGSDITKKLKSRSIMYLNIEQNKTEFKKTISDFYNYRSRFVHGDSDLLIYADILANCFLGDNHKYYCEYYDVSEFGVYLLLVSIQKAIIENRKYLIFDEVIKDGF